MKKINLFLITLIITTMSFGFFCTAYGADKVQGSKRNFYAELSETQRLSRYVTAVIKPVYSNQYGESGLTYYWDCEPVNTNLQGTTSFTFTTNGKHTVRIYSGKNGYPDHLEDLITINLSNVDNTVPQIGNIGAELNEGKWTISLEGCTDNCTSSSSLRSMCMAADQASGFRQASGWNEDRLRNEGSWSSNMSYVKDEGTYCLFLMDEAGNITERDYNTGHLDMTAPVFTGDPVIENEGGSDGYTHAVLITVNAEDNEKMNAYPYSFNGGQTWQEGNQLRVVENGFVEVKARDRAGNESETLEIEISNIDNEAPAISLTQNEDNRNDGSVEITVNASDSLSGVSELSYQNDDVGIPVIIAGGDGSASESRGTSVTINQNGTYTFFASDILGNISSSKINVVRAVKTEYRDAGDKSSGSGPSGPDNGSGNNTGKDGSKDSDKKNKDKNGKDKNRDKKDSSSSGKTTIINPGTGSKEASGSYTSSPVNTGTENRIVIKDSDTSDSGKGSSENSGKVKKSSSSSRTITVSSPDAAGSSKSGTKTYSLYDDDISGLDDSAPSEEEPEEATEETDQPEIREVTLDEYLAGPDDKELHEEEIVPELSESGEDPGKKNTGVAGKILMTCVILIILAVLTLLLLISKGIISIPEIDAEDSDDEDNDTGDLSIFDRIKGALTK